MKKKILSVIFSFLLICPSVFLLSVRSACSFAEGSHQYSRVLDYSGCLSDEEEYALSEKADEISGKYGCDVLVVFTPYVSSGKTITQEADDFYDYTGYGFGPERSGVLLYIATDGREYAISTSGYGIDAFTDAGLSYIVDKMLPSLRESNWAEAADVFISQSDSFLRQASNGNPYDVNNMPKVFFSPAQVLGSTGIGAILGGIPLIKKKKEMKSVRAKENAADYVIPGSFVLTAHNDSFIRKSLSRVPIPKDTSRSGGGGGSSIHISSSGSSHGGTSGRF